MGLDISAYSGVKLIKPFVRNADNRIIWDDEHDRIDVVTVYGDDGADAPGLWFHDEFVKIEKASTP